MKQLAEQIDEVKNEMKDFIKEQKLDSGINAQDNKEIKETLKTALSIIGKCGDANPFENLGSARK